MLVLYKDQKAVCDKDGTRVKYKITGSTGKVQERYECLRYGTVCQGKYCLPDRRASEVLQWVVDLLTLPTPEFAYMIDRTVPDIHRLVLDSDVGMPYTYGCRVPLLAHIAERWGVELGIRDVMAWSTIGDIVEAIIGKPGEWKWENVSLPKMSVAIPPWYTPMEFEGCLKQLGMDNVYAALMREQYEANLRRAYRERVEDASWGRMKNDTQNR